MKLWRKSTGILLSLTLAATMLAACGSNGDTKSADQPNTGNSEAAGKPFTKYDPPVEVTTAIALRDSDKLLNGDTPENNPISRWAEKEIGIKTKYKWLLTDQNDALNQKIRLAMASGEELPDVLYISDNVVLNELMDSGMIEPIDEAFDKYATDRMKKAYENSPAVWNTVTKDGKHWGLPQVGDGPTVVGDSVMWIRQDWLDAVGMKAPTNLKELEALMAAFKAKYPDKVPMSYAGKNNLASWMADASFVFGENQPYQWNKDASGNLQYGSIQPSVKQALQTLNDWYKKGYIDPEFGTQDEQKASSQFTAGNSGIIFGPGWMGGWPLNDTLKNVKGAVVKAYQLPSGVNDKLGHKGSKATYGAYVFRKGFDKFEGIFKYFDASLSRTILDPNSPFANGFAEGYDYTMENGKPVWKDAPATKAGIDIQRYLMLNAGGTGLGLKDGKSIYERVAEGKKDTVYEQQLGESNGPLYNEGFVAAAQEVKSAYPDMFNAAPTETMADKWTLLGKSEAETFLKIVYGKVGIDEFDKFVADWKAKGGDKITEEVNEWYKSVNK